MRAKPNWPIFTPSGGRLIPGLRLSPLSDQHCPRSPVWVGSAIRSTHSSPGNMKSAPWRRGWRRQSTSATASVPSISSASRRRASSCTRFSPTLARTPMRRWWISCFPRRATASAGPHLDGYLALRRLGRLRGGASRQPATLWHCATGSSNRSTLDKGYDRMCGKMLAADELFPTMSAHCEPPLPRPQLLPVQPQRLLDAVVEHTGKAFLGLTLNCARCHDHFFDRADRRVLRFRAIFEPHRVRTDRLPACPTST